jgi:hypothetical protein
MPWSGARQLLNAHQALRLLQRTGRCSECLCQAVERLHLQAFPATYSFISGFPLKQRRPEGVNLVPRVMFRVMSRAADHVEYVDLSIDPLLQRSRYASRGIAYLMLLNGIAALVLLTSVAHLAPQESSMQCWSSAQEPLQRSQAHFSRISVAPCDFKHPSEFPCGTCCGGSLSWPSPAEAEDCRLSQNRGAVRPRLG